MIENLINDFPQQFKGKPRIEALVKALDEQVKDIQAVLNELLTGRNINVATGKQLDMLGDNIGLTRVEAMKMTEEGVDMDDDLYRKLLKHKAYRNANSCTYYDLMQELSVVLGGKTIRYEEVEGQPATILLSSPTGDLGQIPASTPAGVNVVYQNGIQTEINYIPRFSFIDYDTPKCGTFRCGTRRV